MSGDKATATTTFSSSDESADYVPLVEATIETEPLAETTETSSSSQATWLTVPDCADGCFYTTCESADDYNMVARHVGDPHTTDCCTIYCLRRHSLLFCGVCILSAMAEKLKLKYERKHNLKHQETPCEVSCCCPEIIWAQIRRDYHKRHGTRNMPAARAPPRAARMAGR